MYVSRTPSIGRAVLLSILIGCVVLVLSPEFKGNLAEPQFAVSYIVQIIVVGLLTQAHASFHVNWLRYSLCNWRSNRRSAWAGQFTTRRHSEEVQATEDMRPADAGLAGRLAGTSGRRHCGLCVLCLSGELNPPFGLSPTLSLM
jgi:hypothetical protein